jgi:hypothetical protein
VVEEVRDLVERVQPGGHHDVEVDLGIDPLHPGDVAADPHDGGVDDRVDPELGERPQLGDRVGDPFLLVPPRVAVVLHDVRAEHEHVLVHQGDAEGAHVHRPAHGLDHRRLLFEFAG